MARARLPLASCAALLALLTTSCAVCRFQVEQLSQADDDPVRAQARAIDGLEAMVEEYGSIVPKQADVWGQARLTLHRHEFEKQLRLEAGNFKPGWQEAVTRNEGTQLAGVLNLAGGPTPPAILKAPESLLHSPAPVVQGKPGAKPPQTPPPSDAQPTLESIVTLDQKVRYLNHLNELRRINEGDDTADYPGYSLNLLRIPVSILAGSKTKTGHGAEITFTAKPFVGGAFLPRTLRCLVINDLVDQLALPLSRLFEAVDVEEELRLVLLDYAKIRTRRTAQAVTRAGATAAPAARLAPPVGATEASESISVAHFQETSENLEAVARHLQKLLQPGASGSRRRSSRLPLPTSQIMFAFGNETMALLAVEMHRSVQDPLVRQRRSLLLDVQRSLQEELEAAYDLLSCPECHALWDHCTPALAKAIRLRQETVLAGLRHDFHRSLGKITDPRTTAGALAWAIMVESALLNEHLLNDMNETAALKSCDCRLPSGTMLVGPEPAAAARAAFDVYVQQRWPLRIFALDPVAQNRNILSMAGSDDSQRLALAPALGIGHIQGSALAQFGHRVEESQAAAGAHATIIGFCHGGQTFGWRFLPRLAYTGNDSSGPQQVFADMQNGVRECVAIVVMPSFVPAITLDVQTRWFDLQAPHRSLPSLEQTLSLKQTLRQIQRDCQETQQQTGPEDGDLVHLRRRVDQIAARLPLQAQIVKVPFENALGGFEVFDNGTTALAPELIGWYGGPGVYPDKESSVFLVGNNFSVHQTRVIAGGEALDAARLELLSRQVMRVTIPPTGARSRGHLAVHVATPHGVTQPLTVPIAGTGSLAPDH